jgi:hypothetical protein
MTDEERDVMIEEMYRMKMEFHDEMNQLYNRTMNVMMDSKALEDRIKYLECRLSVAEERIINHEKSFHARLIPRIKEVIKDEGNIA